MMKKLQQQSVAQYSEPLSFLKYVLLHSKTTSLVRRIPETSSSHGVSYDYGTTRQEESNSEEESHLLEDILGLLMI